MLSGVHDKPADNVVEPQTTEQERRLWWERIADSSLAPWLVPIGLILLWQLAAWAGWLSLQGIANLWK